MGVYGVCVVCARLMIVWNVSSVCVGEPSLSQLNYGYGMGCPHVRLGLGSSSSRQGNLH